MLREFCVQVERTAVFMLAKLRFLQYVREFFPDKIFLLFIENINLSLSVVEPGMIKHFFGG